MANHIELTTIADGIAQLRLARPPVNALNPAFLNDIADALAALRDDDAVRAVILTGTGKVLSAGMDLKEAMAFDRPAQTAMAEALNRCFAAAYEFPKPLIAAANGHAIAGGLFLILVADWRIVSSAAKLGLTEVRVGIAFPAVPNVIATHELGASAARRLMFGGQNVSADEALGMGFVDAVTAPDQVAGAALARAGEYARIPPRAYAAVKQQVRAQTVERYRIALHAGDPARDGWFTAETRPAAQALLDGQR